MVVCAQSGALWPAAAVTTVCGGFRTYGTGRAQDRRTGVGRLLPPGRSCHLLQLLGGVWKKRTRRSAWRSALSTGADLSFAGNRLPLRRSRDNASAFSTERVVYEAPASRDMDLYPDHCARRNVLSRVYREIHPVARALPLPCDAADL